MTAASGEMHRRLQNRFRHLWILELLNALIVFPLFYYLLGSRHPLGWFSLMVLIVVCAILLVGAASWWVKSRSLDDPEVLAKPLLRGGVRLSKFLFGAMLATLVVIFPLRVFVHGGDASAELLTGGALLVLAVLEYINYYFFQLMYDTRSDITYLFTHRRLKRGALARIWEV